MSEFDLLDVILAIFISVAAIGTIWAVNSILGAFIPTQIWLVIIGLLGIAAIYIFVQMRD